MVAPALLLLVGDRALPAGDKDDYYTVVIKRVEVHKTKADGSSWDPMNGAPDIYVRVQNATDKSTKAYETKVKDDTFVAEFNEPTNVKFKKGQQLHFEVMDKDTVSSDEIGSINVNATKFKEGEPMRIENFGRVISMDIVFKKI